MAVTPSLCHFVFFFISLNLSPLGITSPPYLFPPSAPASTQLQVTPRLQAAGSTLQSWLPASQFPVFLMKLKKFLKQMKPGNKSKKTTTSGLVSVWFKLFKCLLLWLLWNHTHYQPLYIAVGLRASLRYTSLMTYTSSRTHIFCIVKRPRFKSLFCKPPL